MGGRLGASCRPLRELRGFEVPEHRHRHRARDRRCRHDKRVRDALAPGTQRITLLNPKAVLLVDHHEPEVRKLNRLAQQRVRAHDDSGGSRRCLGERLTPGRRALRAGEENDTRRSIRTAEHSRLSQRSQERPHGALMLRRKHFSWREQGRLTARIDHAQHRPQRDHRFAGAHVTLQEAQHRRGL